MSTWAESLADALATQLASTLGSSFTVTRDLNAFLAAQTDSAVVVLQLVSMKQRLDLSEIGNRTHDLAFVAGVGVNAGMSDSGLSDALGDALLTVYDAVWSIVAPGAFAGAQNIEAVVSIEWSKASASRGSVDFTLRVWEDS